ncbi:MAG: hypothetical protein ACLR0A_17470, partial [Faecalibacillus intestinalis]
AGPVAASIEDVGNKAGDGYNCRYADLAGSESCSFPAFKRANAKYPKSGCGQRESSWSCAGSFHADLRESGI